MLRDLKDIFFGCVWLYCVGWLFFNAALPVAGSMVAFKMRQNYQWEGCDYHQCKRVGLFGYERLDAAQRLKESRDGYAANLCPDYLNGNAWERWVQLRNLSWCEDYRGRI